MLLPNVEKILQVSLDLDLDGINQCILPQEANTIIKIWFKLSKI